MLPFLLLLCFTVRAQSYLGNGYLGNGKMGGGSIPADEGGGGITNTTLGLHNWWKMDEGTGTTTADSSDSATGTLSGSPTPTWISGQINGAIELTGGFSSTWIDLAANTVDGPLTITAWVKSSTYAGACSTQIIIFDSDNDTSHGFVLERGRFIVVYSSQDLRRVYLDDLTTGWSHVAVTWDGTTSFTGVHIYTNAVEVVYTSGQNGTGSHGINTTANRYVGAGQGHAQGVCGDLDDVRLYTRVLDSGEITNIFQWRGEP